MAWVRGTGFGELMPAVFDGLLQVPEGLRSQFLGARVAASVLQCFEVRQPVAVEDAQLALAVNSPELAPMRAFAPNDRFTTVQVAHWD